MARSHRPVAFLAEVPPKEPIGAQHSTDDEEYRDQRLHALPFLDLDRARAVASAQDDAIVAARRIS